MKRSTNIRWYPNKIKVNIPRKTQANGGIRPVAAYSVGSKKNTESVVSDVVVVGIIKIPHVQVADANARKHVGRPKAKTQNKCLTTRKWV